MGTPSPRKGPPLSSLPFDVARCMGRGCSEKDTCLRYLDKPNDALRLVIYYSLKANAGACFHKIEAEEEDHE